MSRLHLPVFNEALFARLFAASALLLVAAVVLGLGRPAKAETHAMMDATSSMSAARCSDAP